MTALQVIQGSADSTEIEAMDDTALLLLTAAGRVEAFGALVERHEVAIRRFLGKLVGPAEADDLCQETFMELWRRREHYREQGKFRALLYRVARSKAISHLRWRGVRLRFASSERGAARGAPPPGDGAALDTLLQREQDDRIARAVIRLPYKLREAVVLHYAEGLDYATMSSVTGASESALRVRAHRGIALLRQSLAAQEAS